MIRNILLIDPLTLLGRELLSCLADEGFGAADMTYRHTSEDDEHQIAELGGQPGLVPPVDDPAELPTADVVVITSDRDTPRLRRLVEHLDAVPAQPVLDVSGLAVTRDLARVVTWRVGEGGERVRLAHPALTAAAAVADALAELAPIGGSLAVVEPVSAGGREAVELLAEQAVHRLQGGTPEALFDGHILAFNAVAWDPGRLVEDAAQALPDLPLAVTWTRSGFFHGHLSHLSLELAAPVDDDSSVLDLLEADERIEVVDGAMGLDEVVESNRVRVSLPVFSRDRRRLAVTLMVDGLRIGGARTAVDILRRL